MADYPIDPNCIFCKIIAGDIPCYKVFEDEQVLAFLDVNPITPGHTLVVPKGHYETVDALPPEVWRYIGPAISKVSAAVKSVTNAEGLNVLQNNGAVAGQSVFHVHFHLIPRVEGDGLGYRWSPEAIDKDRAPAMVEAMTKAL